MTEIVLATLPGGSPREQVLVVLVTLPGEPSRVSLRQQSWGEGIGWYTQNTIDLGTQQVAGLRSALGKSGARWSSAPSFAGESLPNGLRIAQVESA